MGWQLNYSVHFPQIPWGTPNICYLKQAAAAGCLLPLHTNTSLWRLNKIMWTVAQIRMTQHRHCKTLLTFQEIFVASIILHIKPFAHVKRYVSPPVKVFNRRYIQYYSGLVVVDMALYSKVTGLNPCHRCITLEQGTSPSATLTTKMSWRQPLQQINHPMAEMWWKSIK